MWLCFQLERKITTLILSHTHVYKPLSTCRLHKWVCTGNVIQPEHSRGLFRPLGSLCLTGSLSWVQVLDFTLLTSFEDDEAFLINVRNRLMICLARGGGAAPTCVTRRNHFNRTNFLFLVWRFRTHEHSVHTQKSSHSRSLRLFFFFYFTLTPSLNKHISLILYCNTEIENWHLLGEHPTFIQHSCYGM